MLIPLFSQIYLGISCTSKVSQCSGCFSRYLLGYRCFPNGPSRYLMYIEGISRYISWLLLKVSFKVYLCCWRYPSRYPSRYLRYPSRYPWVRSAQWALRLNDVGVEVWSKFARYINDIHIKFDKMSTKLRHQSSTKLRHHIVQNRLVYLNNKLLLYKK